MTADLPKNLDFKDIRREIQQWDEGLTEEDVVHWVERFAERYRELAAKHPEWTSDVEIVPDQRKRLS